MTRDSAHGHDARYPISRKVAVDSLPPKGTTVTVEATPEECRQLAEVLDILAIDWVRAELTVAPWRKTGAKVAGEVSAAVKQACVVTLDPVDEIVREGVDLTFLPPEDLGKLTPVKDLEMELPDLDAPEPLESRFIDLGDIVAEFVAMGLDPYPRKPGAVFEPIIEDDPANDDKIQPFAGLSALKPEEKS